MAVFRKNDVCVDIVIAHKKSNGTYLRITMRIIQLSCKINILDKDIFARAKPEISIDTFSGFKYIKTFCKIGP
jgi:hypothetical protein